MQDTQKEYQFPWGLKLGDLEKGNDTIPLYTKTDDGGFCLLYDDASEHLADDLLQGLSLELLATMPGESLKVTMFDYGRKKFYNLSGLQPMGHYVNAYDDALSMRTFDELEKLIVSRYKDLLCCNRQTIDEHNQKSKMKQTYQLILINLEVFPNNKLEMRRINNFLESAHKAGVFIIPFSNKKVLENEDEATQAFLKRFNQLHIENEKYNFTQEIFEFMELLRDHIFKPLKPDFSSLMEKIFINTNLDDFLDPKNIKLEENTKL